MSASLSKKGSIFPKSSRDMSKVLHFVAFLWDFAGFRLFAVWHFGHFTPFPYLIYLIFIKNRLHIIGVYLLYDETINTPTLEIGTRTTCCSVVVVTESQTRSGALSYLL